VPLDDVVAVFLTVVHFEPDLRWIQTDDFLGDFDSLPETVTLVLTVGVLELKVAEMLRLVAADAGTAYNPSSPQISAARMRDLEIARMT
jgi:hypothetical protein